MKSSITFQPWRFQLDCDCSYFSFSTLMLIQNLKPQNPMQRFLGILSFSVASACKTDLCPYYDGYMDWNWEIIAYYLGTLTNLLGERTAAISISCQWQRTLKRQEWLVKASHGWRLSAQPLVSLWPSADAQPSPTSVAHSLYPQLDPLEC